MKAILVLFLLFVNVNLFGQINLVSDKIWRNKVQAALDIVYKYEPALFNNIIVNSTIQAGDLGVAGYAGFCDVQVTPSGKILWIMIGIEELKNSNKHFIASLLVHEALHLKNRLHDLSGRNWGNFTNLEKKAEHTKIYNYELDFMRRILAPYDEIEGLKRLMRNEKIQIL
jgi:hypothetical protein